MIGTNETELYVSPAVECVEMKLEGVIAGSAGTVDFGGNAFEEGDE